MHWTRLVLRRNWYAGTASGPAPAGSWTIAIFPIDNFHAHAAVAGAWHVYLSAVMTYNGRNGYTDRAGNFWHTEWTVDGP